MRDPESNLRGEISLGGKEEEVIDLFTDLRRVIRNRVQKRPNEVCYIILNTNT